ncbi:NAD(P)-dependent alcohol dehydrogenase [Oceanobacillus piezotolerans]|uniref:NAD(P)-dependent alcohol dehydrogenase n=1 Tax=Oceanobacillus piezotolerans TaxID=2448030 RepID=A0A498D9H5_9BACI|nr:NAD(P)-dependent alcohol dehydrogenase [Oceanobacillus piezotolerans]RLL45467.1 NAD(P)-dependent alcohol dehydrogenase [Oceanobacillus piezotolerans]
MKAVVTMKYGSPEMLQLREVDKPVPDDNQVLVKVHAASLNKGNIVMLRGEPVLARPFIGLTKPKHPIPGGDMAGIVEAVGKNIKDFQVGDEVFGDLSASGWGSYAEYVVAPEKALVKKPRNLSFEEAASVPMAAVTALQGLKKGNIKQGERVLIYGASGGVGTFAVQIAKAYGAEVTAFCSEQKKETVESLGADHVYDYKKEDLTNHTARYDLIIGVNGYQPISVYKRALSQAGRYVMIGGSTEKLYESMFLGAWHSLFGKKKMTNLLQRANKEDLEEIRKLLEREKLNPVIDRVFPLNDIQNAFRYMEEGHAKGKVVITI